MDQNRVENQVDEGTLQIHLTNCLLYTSDAADEL